VVQNVVTYDAVVGISNEELILKPGMTANVQFLVKQKTDVLRIPNTALRFRPEGIRSGTPRPAAGTSRPSREGTREGGRRSRDGERSRRQGGSGERGERRSNIYVLKEGAPTPVQVRLGISDGTYTELVDGNLNDGQEIILSMTEDAANNSRSGIFNLFRVRGGGGFR
jgi:HlyD family secretion protein